MLDPEPERISWGWHDFGVIIYTPSYLFLRPMHVLGNCRHRGIHFHHPSLLSLLVIWLCDKDNIALVMFSVLISGSVADMSIITPWIVHLVHNFSSFLI